eukprot:TRINITY_DN9367_c0_g1_i2.p1 TRINITY_DN9367_c0_g1~~TRINITY_DN9367_c0_g1_i2.p1  ORF type:complete len:1041 (+),score=291.40 TRINITY_DN9367_c0_g1_i2:359-3124(+)
MSHPQALAQCDNYLRAQNITPQVGRDTAGSAKLIQDQQLRTTAAIASRLAAETYNLKILEEGIEDSKTNYTRFLLVRRTPVVTPSPVPSKCSVVFSLRNAAGALFKAIACFAMRDLDLTKIESRPGVVNITEQGQAAIVQDQDLAHTRSSTFQYMFYLDVLGNAQDPNLRNALEHLAELANFVRVLGCYPSDGVLVHDMQQPRPFPPSMHASIQGLPASTAAPPSTNTVDNVGLHVAIVGFGNFGQFLARRWAALPHHCIYATSRSDYSEAARRIGATFASSLEQAQAAAQAKRQSLGEGDDNPGLDVIILAPSVLSFETVVAKLDRKLFANKLVVDVLSVKVHPKTVLLQALPESADILCTHPMFGPESGKHSWKDLPMVYELVRARPTHAWRSQACLNLFRDQGCRMVGMTCEEHDRHAAGSQFITHFTGRVLSQLGLVHTPINTKGYETLLALQENTCKDSFDLFYALFKYNTNSDQTLSQFAEAFEHVAKQLRASDPNQSTAKTGDKVDQANDDTISPLVAMLQGSATVQVHSLTQKLLAEGQRIVSLNVGEPDWACPDEVKAAVAQAMEENNTRYTSVAGSKAMKQAIVQFYKERRQLDIEPDNIVVSNGAKQSLFQAFMALCREGDRVVLPSPYWVTYKEQPVLARATVHAVECRPEDGFLLQPAQLRQALTKDTRALLLCNPSNPTGAMYTREQLEALAQVLREPEFQHVWIISDEIYHQLVLDPDTPPPVSFATLPGMQARTIVIDGVSKAYAMTGFRLGWMIAPSKVAKACSKLQGQVTSCASSISQAAAIAALQLPASHQAPTCAVLRERRDIVYQALLDLSEYGVVTAKPLGAFYIFPKIDALFSKTSPQGRVITSSTDFCTAALQEADISMVPGEGFGAPQYIRIAYATSTDELKRAMTNLTKFVKALK